MQLKTTLSAITATLALAGPAAAQMYPGQDVTVNPNAIPRGEYLLYPNGVYMRVQPGGEPIRLHMPRPHRHHVAKAATPTDTTVASTTPDTTAAPSTDTSATAPSTPPASATAPLPAPVPDVNSGGTPDTTAATPSPKPSHHKHSKAATQVASYATPTTAPAATAPTPAPAQTTGDLPFMFATNGPPPAAPAQPQQPSKPAKVTKVAATEPPPAQTSTPATPPTAGEDSARQNLYKHGAIMFVKDATDPSPSQFDGVKTLATDLNAALEAGASRIQIEAYGGSPGDKSSDARRLSLKRALAVRQLLIDDGVPSSRIDVRAMGGIDDKGPADRVDVYVRAS